MTCPVCHGPAVEPPSPDRVPVLVDGALVPYTARRCARCPRVFYAPEEVK